MPAKGVKLEKSGTIFYLILENVRFPKMYGVKINMNFPRDHSLLKKPQRDWASPFITDINFWTDVTCMVVLISHYSIIMFQWFIPNTLLLVFDIQIDYYRSSSILNFKSLKYWVLMQRRHPTFFIWALSYSGFLTRKVSNIPILYWSNS